MTTSHATQPDHNAAYVHEDYMTYHLHCAGVESARVEVGDVVWAPPADSFNPWRELVEVLEVRGNGWYLTANVGGNDVRYGRDLRWFPPSTVFYCARTVAEKALADVPAPPAPESIALWACTDCLMLFANGETPPEMTEDDTATWLAEIDRRTDGYHVAVGGEHEDGCPNVAEDGSWIGSTDCYCETEEFTWRSCGTCGSKLGGSRHAVTLFPAVAR